MNDNHGGGGGSGVSGIDGREYGWNGTSFGYWETDPTNRNYIDENGNVVVSANRDIFVTTAEGYILGGNAQQGIPTVAQFTEFANFFFGQEAGMIKQNAALNWQIGRDLGSNAGRTSRRKDGSILI